MIFATPKLRQPYGIAAAVASAASQPARLAPAASQMALSPAFATPEAIAALPPPAISRAGGGAAYAMNS